MIQILSVQDIKQAELESYSMGESSNSLVKKAANSISDYIVTEFPKDTNTNIVIISGAGNNGNDGILAGCYLATKGYNVTIFRFKNKNLVLPDYVRLEINERNKTKDIEYFEFSNVSYFEEQLFEQLSLANIIVDSLLGIGMNRPLSEDLSNLVNIINSFSSNKNTVISIDIPTGINADTGEVYNNDILENNKLAVSADKLLVLNYPKIGLFNLPALEYFQDYVVLKSGVNSRMVSNNFLMEITDFEKILPYRPTSSYKGTFGKLLIIGSSKEFSGAAFLAGKAAYRAGVGLVSIATTESAISLYGSYLPEAIYCPLDEQTNGMISSNKSNYSILEKVISQYDAVLIGCGIGKSQETMEIVKFVIDYHNKYNNQFNLIIDADGINNLAELTNHSNVTLNNTILTPHLGELANLGHQSLSNITLNDRFRLSDEILNQLTGEKVSKNQVFKNNVIIAKGPYTQIIDGLKNTFVSPFATPLLSTAGSGDVLAGLVASLSSQNVSTLNSALLGVYLHGLSAVLKKPQYGNTGLLASDIADNIPFAIKKIQDHK
jgi:NAD(P)H-hydrate epimerase|tara:strand:- start:2347 stop:3993 length:1647 start_codon:yes stop_codon:yes gene_type:complete